MNLQLIEIQFGTPEYDEAISLRYDVLRKPLNMEYTPEQISEEFNQFHFGIYSPNSPILGCLTFQLKDSKTLKMRQVAVSSSFQNKGIGAFMVKEAEKWSRENGFNKIILHARQNAVKFYLRLGYDIVGDTFLEVSIPHSKMTKKLS